MNKRLTTKAEWAKHLRPYGKRAANKKHRKACAPLIYYPKPYGARNRIHPLTEKEREHRVREIEKQGGWIEEEEEDGKQYQA